MNYLQISHLKLPTSLTEQLSQCVNTAIAIDSQWEMLSTVTLGQA